MSISTKEFITALKTASLGIVKSKNPYSQCILMEFESMYTPTLSRQRMHLTLPKPIAQGRIVVDCKDLLDKIKTLPKDSRIDKIIPGEGCAEIHWSNSAIARHFTVPSLDPDNFPLYLDKWEDIPDKIRNTTLSVNSDLLKSKLGQVMPAMAFKDIRYYLNGVFFDVRADNLTLVGTDGPRLHQVNCQVISSDGTADFVVPDGVVKMIYKTLPKDQTVTINVSTHADYSHRFIDVKYADIVINFKSVDGKFPDWRRVVPESSGRVRLSIDKKPLLDALNRIRPFCDKKFQVMVMTVEAGNVLIKAGEQIEQIPSDCDSWSAATGFNIDYLEDAIKSNPGDIVHFYYQSSANSMLVQDEDYNAVVMPVRL